MKRCALVVFCLFCIGCATNFIRAQAPVKKSDGWQPVRPIMPVSEGKAAPKMNHVEKSVEGLLVLTARIPASSPAGGKIPLVLELKNWEPDK